MRLPEQIARDMVAAERDRRNAEARLARLREEAAQVRHEADALVALAL